MRQLFLFLAVATLSACSHLQALLPENQIVAAKCTNIDSLIRKNVSAGINGNFAIAAGGMSYVSQSPQISNLQATILVQTNQACRSWALGGMSTEKWNEFLDHRLAASIALSGVEDKAAVGKVIGEVIAMGTAEDSAVEPGVQAKRVEQILEERARFQEQGLEDVRQTLERQYADVREAIDKKLTSIDRISAQTGAQSLLLQNAIANLSTSGVPLDSATLARMKELRDRLTERESNGGASDTAAILSELQRLKRGEEHHAHLEPISTLEPADRANLNTLAAWVAQQQAHVKERLTPPIQGQVLLPDVTVHFGVADTETTYSGLDALRGLLQQFAGQALVAEVEGYSDTSGNSRANLILSERRALLVRDALLEQPNITVRSAVGKGATVQFGQRAAQNRVVVVRLRSVL
ncbi:OmpA family protein [Janthinobacterium sp. PC23-8]|uniref:OmpA family protein n=1 Tax=Janthinobacterium sp. PC23-8 TaxID=2012679 RepID=UPI000B97CAD3|nr:OmpA family protein [Janthinobacterium sp. PC23-8]OYO31564.1 hypothetical protein CD932_10860 [Janthinobacterium sp. PC23-8]